MTSGKKSVAERLIYGAFDQIQTKSGKDPIEVFSLALDNLKPKVFWKDKPVILRQVRKWNCSKLEIVKQTILEVEIIMKTKMNNYNTILLKNLFVKIFKIANSSS